MKRFSARRSYNVRDSLVLDNPRYTPTPELDESLLFLQDNPLKILEEAENGNVQEFQRIVTIDRLGLLKWDSKGRTAAHLAALKNHIGILKIIAKNETNFEDLDEDGNTPLHLAVDSEAVDAISFLLKHGADADILNKKLQSPLHLAAELGKVTALKALANHSSLLEVNLPGERGRTPLHLACVQDQFDCVKILIEELQASPCMSCSDSVLPIHDAAKYGSWNALGALLNSAAKYSCSIEEMMNFQDDDGNLPLHFAVQSRDVKTVQLCLESGSQISSIQNDLSTAVHLACAQGSTDIVKLMFTLQPKEKDKCLEACDMELRTPMHYAAMFDHTELVEYLVNQGSNLNPLDKNNSTPLYLAASRNAWKTINYLLGIGADPKIQDKGGRTFLHTIIQHNGDLCKIVDEVNHTGFAPILEIQDKKGNTALHVAALHGHNSSVNKLLSMGSSITNENVEGDNVFQIACRFGHTQIIQMIVDHPQFSAVMNDTNHHGRAPVHSAAQEGHLKVLQMLMKRGAYLPKDNDGQTPLHLAAEKGYREIASQILSTHSVLVNDANNNGNTPLHIAALHNQAKVAEILLSHNCDITYNIDDCSPIDLAIMNNYKEVAYVLVTHPTRGEEVLGLSKGKYPCIMEALIAKMPAVAKAVLDTGIKKCSTEKSDSLAYYVEYDFNCLSKPEDCSNTKKGSAYLPVLNDMVIHERVGLLSHELSMKYMAMKWEAYGKYFQFANLIFYLLYLLIVTSVATNEIERDFKFYVRFKWFNESEESCTETEDEPCEPPTYVGRGQQEFQAFREYRKATNNYEWRKLAYAMIWIMALIAAVNLLLEFISMYRHGIKYCKTIDTWVWIIMNISCLVANFFQISARIFKANPSLVTYDLVNPGLANAVFMGWFYLFIMMQRFDAIGLYVSMFLEIVKTLLRVLVVFSALILAFALTFYVLLSNGNHLAFASIPMSTIRTFMMMMGDIDFTSTFVFPHYCEEMEQTGRTDSRLYSTLEECKFIRRITHPYTSFWTVCIFILFMPIVMINLLIGLAVGDIEAVRKNAQLKRLSMQVQTHINIEKTLPKFMMKRLDKTSMVEYPNMRQKISIVNYLSELFRYAEDKEEDELNMESDYTREAALECKVKLAQLTTDIENLKTMIQLVSNKLMVNSSGDFGSEAGTPTVKTAPKLQL